MKYNLKKIFSLKVMLQLKTQGFEVLYTEPNREKPHLTVWVFEGTEELLDALTTITTK